MEIKDLYNEDAKPVDGAEQKLNAYLNAHHERFHNILFWANVAILVNLLIVVNRLVHLCPADAPQLLYLKVGLGFICLAMTGFLYGVWKADTTLGPEDWEPAKVLLQYKIEVMNKQAWLIGGYLVAYTLALGTAYLFYHFNGLVKTEKVLGAMSSISLMMYGFGGYSLWACLSRRAKLVGERNARSSGSGKTLSK